MSTKRKNHPVAAPPTGKNEQPSEQVEEHRLLAFQRDFAEVCAKHRVTLTVEPNAQVSGEQVVVGFRLAAKLRD